MRPEPLLIDLELIVPVVFGAAWTILPPASWCWPSPAKRDRKNFSLGARLEQITARVLHRHLAAEIAVDPFHRAFAVDGGPLGDEVVDVLRPVLDGRVAHASATLDDDLDDCAVQRITAVSRCGAAFHIMDVAARLGDDERPLELTGVLRIDAEVRL